MYDLFETYTGQIVSQLVKSLVEENGVKETKDRLRKLAKAARTEVDNELVEEEVNRLVTQAVRLM